VGILKEPFFIDVGVLHKSGSFFPTALKKQWKEGQQKIIELPEEQPQIFRIYAQWLYTAKIFCRTDDRREDIHTLCELYTPGEKLMDRTLQDRAMDALSSLSAVDEEDLWLPYFCTVDYVCEHLPDNSPARRFLIDRIAEHCNGELDNKWPAYLRQMSQALLADVVLALSQQRKHTKNVKGRCTYHLHAQSQPCSGSEDL